MPATLGNGTMAESQYCEPQKLRRYSSSGTHMPSTGNTFTREQRLLVEEIPGYSEPLQCIATPTKVSWGYYYKYKIIQIIQIIQIPKQIISQYNTILVVIHW